MAPADMAAGHNRHLHTALSHSVSRASVLPRTAQRHKLPAHNCRPLRGDRTGYRCIPPQQPLTLPHIYPCFPQDPSDIYSAGHIESSDPSLYLHTAPDRTAA